MKAVIVVTLVVCLISVVLASPAKDLKEAKKEAAKKKACMSECGAEKYQPICAGKAGAKSLSFGNQCVLNNYNCEKNESLAKISEGECPGGSGVRLS